MSWVLGIDAAWTASEPSGVALVGQVDGRWRCAGLAPSDSEFCALAYLAGRATPYGDATAAIWVPAPLDSAPSTR
ncbi:hypothetical protein L6R52_19305 [Myxococcota bacterium]|nr:hypothetical protein [Myxococcota bacterium]